MKKMKLPSRVLSLLLAFTLVLGMAAPAIAVNDSENVSYREVDNGCVSGSLLTELQEPEADAPEYDSTDVVRVSIFLKEKSTLDAGFSTLDISSNVSAMSYQKELKTAQQRLVADIERATGEELDVRWNLTLAANAISANVEYGQIETIEQLSGVEKVVLETRYEPQESAADAAEPNMTISTQMTGTVTAWESGYTGAGMRVAIIDTGLDINHQSVDAGAFLYALEENAQNAGMTYEEYAASVDLLDAAEIQDVLAQLHVTERGTFTAEELYINEKLPFGFCYIDEDLDVTHENDTMSQHGSHVAGIAAANRYIPKDGGYVSASEAVGVVGSAPDAQILVMKVFGGNGGAYDSDYMVAIEDAIMLGCDAVNLSLGSANPGSSIYSGSYGDILEAMTVSDTVVSVSMGNSGAWADYAQTTTALPYVDHVNYYTGGSPGSYSTSLTVASVDNDGAVGHVFQVAGRKFPYNETGIYCDELVSLDTSADKSGTEYEYVFLESYGAESDYRGIDVTDKVVFVSRGGGISFTMKAEEAAFQDAAATVVYNNEPGRISMDLTYYYFDEPAVSITQEEGQWIKEHSEAQQTSAGVTYYTGKFFIDQSVVSTYYGEEYLTMSSFTSWGVPGDLSLKPEITAPGGNIFSINGTYSSGSSLLGGTDEYVAMSGTSMAAPQVTGISALVMQAIQEKELSQQGLTDRALAQSLLMSTATPLKDSNGSYYSLLQQGAGMVNAAAATSADSYVLVEGQSDGKVKAELGDDPDKTGVYSFTFTLNNLADTEKSFALSADLFTQDVAEGYANALEEETALFMANSTTPLMALASWSVDGQRVNSANESDNWDFNGDGKTDADDAQTLLDFVTGARETIEHQDSADMNGDGRTDTYDVHLLLNRLGRDSVTVPANGSVEVTVTLTLTDAQKQELDEVYTGGAFIQAFVNAQALDEEEGLLGTSHSIPMLAYYGGWTDSSMYDVGTYQEFGSGEESRATYLGNETANTFAVVYGDIPDTSYFFGGNPMLPDDTYMPERNAINAERGDWISQAYIAPIRNAAASRFFVTHEGETIYETELGEVTGAYYYVNGFSWQSKTSTLRMKWTPESYAEGESFELGLDLAPELYLNDDGVAWDALGEGAKLRVPATIDNTDPVLEKVHLDLVNNTLVVTASDNQYVSAVVLYSASGTTALTYTGAVQEAVPGESYEYVLNLDEVNGKKFLLQVYDYALNTVTYEIEMQIGEELPMPEMMIFALDEGAWITDDFFSAGGYYDSSMRRTIAEVPHTIVAASVVDHMVFAATDKGQLFVAPEEDMTAMEYVSQLPYTVVDMAYNPTNETLYGLTDNCELIEIDTALGDVTVIGTVGMETNTLAVDADGNFYCNRLNSGYIYTFTVDTYASPSFFLWTSLSASSSDGELTQSMEWNPNSGMLYWYGSYEFTYMGYPSGYGYLMEVNPQTYAFKRINQPRTPVGALIITESADNDAAAPTDQVTDVQLSKTELTIHRSLTQDLDAAVRPWFTTDRTVTWTSSDESVATVDENGLVTAVDAGTCEIYATSNLDPTKVGVCQVTVDTVDLKLEGVLKDLDGTTKLFTWDLAAEKTWQTGIELSTAINSVAYDGENTLYLNDALADAGMIYEIDKTTGEIRNTYENAAEVALWDMYHSSYSSTPDSQKIGSVWMYIFMLPCAPDDMGANYYDLQGSTAPLFAVTTLGHEQVEDWYGEVHDAEHFVLLDGDKQVIDMWYYETDGTGTAITRFTPSDLDVTFKLYESENKRTSLVSDEAGNLYLSFFNGTSNDIYSLAYDEEADLYKSELLAHMGEGIWPAALYHVETGAAEPTGDVLSPKSEGTVVLTAETASAGELAALMEAQTAVTGSLNAVRAETLPVEIQGAQSEKDCAAETATVTITADEATTNGLVTLSWDADQLELVDRKGLAQFNSFAAADGVLTFGYANETAAPAGAELATVTFRIKGDAEVTVTTEEDGDKQPGTVETVALSECPSAAFTDVPVDDWYHEYVDYVVENGLMNGISDSLFAPGSNMNRAQLVTVLYRMAGSPAVENGAPFTDVADGTFYADAVAWAYQSGITTGVSSTAFNPNASVTREQMVTFFARYAALSGVSVEAQADLSVYTDASQISAYALESMAWAVETGLIEGVSETMLDPAGTCTRAQVAAVLMRYCEQIG